MPGDIKVLQATGDDTAAPPVATDRIGGRDFQKIKTGFGADGFWTQTSDNDGNRFPIGGAQIGAVDESAPGADSGTSSGLNGRLQRIALRLANLMALLPPSLGQKTMANGLAVTLASDQAAVPVTANAGTNLNTSALVLEANEATRLGGVTETSPASDTASSGLNGRLQRISQRLTTLIGLFPASLGQKTMGNSLSVVLASDQFGSSVMVLRGEAVMVMTVFTGATISNASDTAGYGNMGLIVPNEFDGTQISFTVCDTLGGTYVPLYDITNTPVAVPVSPGRAYDLPGELMAWRFFKIVTATVQTTTNTPFQLVLRS